MELSGKTAVVTGGASGLAEGIVRALAAAGARVLIVDSQKDAAEALAQSTDGIAARADVTDSAEVARIAGIARDAFGGPPDVLVNGAVVNPPAKPFQSVSEEDFDRGLMLNARSLFLTARHIVPAMAERGSGRVINLAASIGLRPRHGHSWSGATSAWVIAATKALANELAAQGVQVNALSTAVGEARAVPSFMGGGADAAPSDIPLGRFTSPQDAGAAAVFLASDAASMITGAILPIDGGRVI